MKRICVLALAAVNAMPIIASEELADSSRVIDLDEVVIISQPKEQTRLRQQPISSSVLSSQEMQQLQIRDLSDLSNFVPSFVMPQYGSRLTSSMYVRGIESRINNPAVGVYYDNIPLMSKAAFNNHFYMLDRVDVLRGPQGTLYGQNTEGGLVRIYSKNPMNYQGTDALMSIGTGLYTNVEIAHHHRPNNKLAFTVAGFYSGLKGFINNANFDEKNDQTNEAGGKLRLLFAPTLRLKFDLTADYQYVNQNGFGYGELDVATNDVADPATTIMNGYKRNMLNTGLSISYDIDGLLLTSITSYQLLKDQMVMDQDYLTPDFLRLGQNQKQNAVTQEIVLRSRGDGCWQHSTGMFGSYQWLRTDAPVVFGDAITGRIGTSIENAMKDAVYGSMIGRFMGQEMSPEAAAVAAQQAVDQMGITMTAEMAVPEVFHTPQLNLAAYHESNILLANRLTATLGLRLDYNKVKIDYDALAYMSLTGGMVGTIATYTLSSHIADVRSKSHTQLLPKFGLTYQLAGNLGNVYATVAKGYRAGGYNIQMFSDILQTDLDSPEYQQQAQRGDVDVPHTAEDYDNIANTITYKPEESWNYEVGSHLNLFNGTVHADIALYYMQIRNQQLSVMSQQYNFGRIMVNAGRSHSLGAELALRGQALGDHIDWSASYAFTKAKFDNYDTYNGKDVPFVPQHTFSAVADYHLNKLTIGFNATGQGKIWWNEANTYAQPFYATLGAHVDYGFGPVLVTLWGRNLTNTRYNTFAVGSTAAGSQKYFAQRANPIQVGLDLRLHF